MTRDVQGRRVISYRETLRMACVRFLAHGGEVDMEALAVDLSVSRATLYRVVDGRERFLGDVLWTLAEPVLSRARAERRSRGLEGIIEVARRFSEDVIGAEPFVRFMAADPDIAAQVLFNPGGGVHERFVVAQRDIFREASQDPDIMLPFDPDRLADVFVRILESLVFADLLAGRRPDLDLAERVARAVLLTADQRAVD